MIAIRCLQKRGMLNLVYTSTPLTRCTIHVRDKFGARLINFPQTWGEQRTHGAWKGHPSHPVLFVFTQKTDKFWFVVNGMRTIRGWHSSGSQLCPHIYAFGSQTIRRAHVYETLQHCHERTCLMYFYYH